MKSIWGIIVRYIYSKKQYHCKNMLKTAIVDTGKGIVYYIDNNFISSMSNRIFEIYFKKEKKLN